MINKNDKRLAACMAASLFRSMGVEMAKWMLAAKKADFDAIAQKFHI